MSAGAPNASAGAARVPLRSACASFLADAFLLASLLAVAAGGGSRPDLPRVWLPGIVLLAWAARERAAGSRGKWLELILGLLALPALTILLKRGVPLPRLGLALGGALVYVLWASPAVHRGLRRAPWLLFTGLALVVAGLLASRYRPAAELAGPPPLSAPADAKNLLLITIDTTRVDSLGCYGAPWNSSPTLDRLAREGVLFQAAIAQAPHTHSSIASLLTAKYPIEHGSLREYYHLDAPNETLAEHLRRLGYRTAAFLDNPWLTREFGFDQGYDEFIESAATSEVVAWLEQPRRRPFFLHVHLLQPHGPYEAIRPYIDEFDPDYPPDAPYQDVAPIELLWDAKERAEAAFSSSELARFRTLQASEIRAMDDEIAAILAALEAGGAAADTLVIVAADHGEEFQEHGSVGHAHTLHEELIHVPLLARFPGVIPAGTRVAAQIELVDVAPTALDLLELPALDAGCGSSYAAHLGGKAPPPDADLAISQLYELRGRQLICLRTPRWKLFVSLRRRNGESRSDLSFERPAPTDLIWGLDTWLYDLLADPAEHHDLAAAQPDIVEQLLAELSAWRATQQPVD